MKDYYKEKQRMKASTVEKHDGVLFKILGAIGFIFIFFIALYIGSILEFKYNWDPFMAMVVSGISFLVMLQIGFYIRRKI